MHLNKGCPRKKHNFIHHSFHLPSCTIKDELLKEKDLEVDFCMLANKPKLYEWLFHAWTQMCERK